MGAHKIIKLNLAVSREDIEKYFSDPEAFKRPTEMEAREFYKTLCFMYNRNENCTCQGIASAEHIAEKLKLDLSATRELCNAMVFYGITERQGGGFVI